MSNVLLTIPDYAKKIKKSRIAVYKAVTKNKLHLLPDVVNIKKIGKYYILEVSKK